MLGIYGGTFDPIHCGHLRAALEVQEALQLKEVRFIPAGIPPHRQPPVASAGQRLAMLQLAVGGVPGFSVDCREMDRAGPSYMVDTLTTLRQDMPDASMALILGMDAFLGLTSWHRWQELIELAHIVVTNRPGYQPGFSGELAELVDRHGTNEPDYLRQAPFGQVYFCTISFLEISATAIRQAVQQGRSVRYLIPDGVETWISRAGLYQNRT